jgi:hypothetical protein
MMEGVPILGDLREEMHKRGTGGMYTPLEEDVGDEDEGSGNESGHGDDNDERQSERARLMRLAQQSGMELGSAESSGSGSTGASGSGSCDTQSSDEIFTPAASGSTSDARLPVRRDTSNEDSPRRRTHDCNDTHRAVKSTADVEEDDLELDVGLKLDHEHQFEVDSNGTQRHKTQMSTRNRSLRLSPKDEIQHIRSNSIAYHDRDHSGPSDPDEALDPDVASLIHWQAGRAHLHGILAEELSGSGRMQRSRSAHSDRGPRNYEVVGGQSGADSGPERFHDEEGGEDHDEDDDELLGRDTVTPMESGSIGVLVCGPKALIDDTARAVREANTSGSVWRGGPVVEFYRDTFGW